MQRSPKALDHSLPDAFQKVMQLEGVQGVHVSYYLAATEAWLRGGDVDWITIPSFINVNIF